jgi:hypothetical protein
MVAGIGGARQADEEGQEEQLSSDRSRNHLCERHGALLITGVFPPGTVGKQRVHNNGNVPRRRNVPDFTLRPNPFGPTRHDVTNRRDRAGLLDRSTSALPRRQPPWFERLRTLSVSSVSAARG